ncbi:hypothetical protein RyT2_25480 [Pseudolactococcus yaeyamensis]
MKMKIFSFSLLIIVASLLISCSPKNTLKLENGDYLPILTSKKLSVTKALEEKGIQSKWGDTGELVIAKDEISYYFSERGALKIVFELPSIYSGKTEGLVENFQGTEDRIENINIGIENIYTTGKVEEISISVGGGLDASACAYKMVNLDKPLRTIPEFGNKKYNDKVIKAYLPNSEVKKIIKQCEEFQSNIKNMTLEK